MFRRWSRRTLIRATLVVAATVAVLVALRAQQREISLLRATVGDRAAVVVATRDVDRGTRLASSDLSIASVPTPFVPPGAIGSMDEAVGLTLVADIAGGEILTASRTGVRAGPVAAQVPDGLRGFVISAPLPPDVIRPGDRVDVLATFGGQHPYTQTVASGLEVLTVMDPGEASAFGAGGEVRASIVLLVGADTAERLAFAVAFGEVSVSIVGAL